jgi:hypothetical protein
MKKRRKYPNTTERIAIFRAAWNDIASAESFAGMTLAEFEARLSPVQANADRLQSLAGQMAAAQTERRQLDQDAREVLELVINAVRGNPNHGPNSQLYRALGYVPKSERRSGLSRGTTPTAPATGEAA